MYIYSHSFTEQIYAIVDVYDDDEFDNGIKRTYIFYSEAEYKHQKNIHYKNQDSLQEVWRERFKNTNLLSNTINIIKLTKEN